jgi:L-serine/L-threonine ammonia-lyase
MQAIHIPTPLLESAPLSRALGCRAWLKMDALQPCGSFKARGIGHACRRHAERGCQRFLSSSGGNAGLVVAYSGRVLGVPVTIVVPASTSERAREHIRQEGAEVIVHGATWQEAHQYALSLCTAGTTYIHPFDDPWVWEGHASLVDEVAASGVRPDVVVLSVGGGGLFCGVVEGLRRHGWTSVPVVTAETAGAESFYRSVQAGQLVELEAITSIATTLGAKKVAARALELSREHPVTACVVSDRAAVDACLAFADDHRVIVEPACGAALALGYGRSEYLRGHGNVLFVVCGGAAATYQSLLRDRERVGL